MLKPIQVSSRDHRCVSSWCWSQYRCHHVIISGWVLDVEASTGVITWSQVSEFLMLKLVQVSSRDHRWVSSWCWSQYRCHHVAITGEWVLDVKASTGVVTWSQVSEFLMLKPVQVSSRDHRCVSSWCWSQYRCHHVITGERVLDVEANTGVITWSQVSEFLMLKLVQVSSRDHRCVSSWCWIHYRCHHAYSWVSNLPVKMTTSSGLPSPAHTSPDRSFRSSTFCMTSLAPTVALTSREQSSAPTAATETPIPPSCSSSLFPTYRQTCDKIIICDKKWRVWILFCELYEHHI